MSLEDGVADLHLHTTASDGTLTVSERLSRAADRGFDAIAVTDHDVIPDGMSERCTVRDGVELITGVEVRADVSDTKVEILGYYIDPTERTLRSTLERAREFRVKRNRALVEQVAAETGLDITYESLAASVEGGLGRPHVADRLVEEGVVDSVGAAFAEYLGEDGSCFVPMQRQPHESVIDAIHAAGGVASLAHPGRIRASADAIEEMVATLPAAGLDGIEVAYPYANDRSTEYAAIDVGAARELAEGHQLLPTGGSDCHGPGSGKHRFGEVRITGPELAGIRTRADQRRPLST